jgi:hypothetical protein
MWQSIGEEIFVCTAFVKGYAFSLASIFAKTIVVAVFAFFINAHAFFNEGFCFWTLFKCGKICFKDIA